MRKKKFKSELCGDGFVVVSGTRCHLTMPDHDLRDVSATVALQAGCDPVSPDVEEAFSFDPDEDARRIDLKPTAAEDTLSEQESDALDDALYAEERVRTRLAYGKGVPPVYRLRVVVEAERLTETEARDYWNQRAVAWKKAEAEAAEAAPPYDAGGSVRIDREFEEA